MKRSLGWFLCGWLAGCHVAAGSEGTGGVGSAFAPTGERPGCPRAFVVVSSDGTSSNVSVTSPSGALLSSSIISSASAGSAVPNSLSADVVLPSATPTSGSLVVLDRSSSAVITWVEPVTGGVLRTLSVASGYASYPSDYLEVTAEKAYVTRAATNPMPGRQPNDAGGDVLIIDPTNATITGRVDLALAQDGALLPHPGRLLTVRDRVWVIVQRASEHSETRGDARVVGLNPVDDSVAWMLDIIGVTSCNGLAVSPSGKEVALACASLADDVNPAVLVLLDATMQPPIERRRFMLSTLGAPSISALSYFSETRLVGIAPGDPMRELGDSAHTLDTMSGVTTVLAQATAPLEFGDVRCSPGCTDECVLTDAPERQLRVWSVHGTQLSMRPPFLVDASLDLPPRSLGTL